MCQRGAVQPRTDRDARRAEPLGERVAAYLFRHDRQHARLVIFLREIDAQRRQIVQPCGKTAQQSALLSKNLLRSFPPDEPDTLAQPGDAADIVRPA